MTGTANASGSRVSSPNQATQPRARANGDQVGGGEQAAVERVAELGGRVPVAFAAAHPFAWAEGLEDERGRAFGRVGRRRQRPRGRRHFDRAAQPLPSKCLAINSRRVASLADQPGSRAGSLRTVRSARRGRQLKPLVQPAAAALRRRSTRSRYEPERYAGRDESHHDPQERSQGVSGERKLAGGRFAASHAVGASDSPPEVGLVSPPPPSGF